MEKLRQIATEEWRTPDEPICVMILPRKPYQMERDLPIRFENCDGDGLGREDFAIVALENYRYLLMAYPQGPEVSQHISVCLQGNEKDPLGAKAAILKALGLTISDLLYALPDLAPPQWGLYRIDEHGTEVEMDRFIEEHAAAAWQKNYEARGHKQTYLIRKIKDA